MAFGILCSKFRILQRPIQVKLQSSGKLFLCCARLHNYIINERIRMKGDFDILAATSTRELEDAVDSTTPSDLRVCSIPGNSIMRDILLQRITDRALVRPRHNVRRNNY